MSNEVLHGVFGMLKKTLDGIKFDASSQRAIEIFIKTTALLGLVDQPRHGGLSGSMFDPGSTVIAKRWEDVKPDEAADVEIVKDRMIKKWFEEVESFFVDSSELSDGYNEIRKKLNEQLRQLPFQQLISPSQGHREAYSSVLRGIIRTAEFRTHPNHPKFMIVGFALLALDRGAIPPNKLALMHEFKTYFGIEDELFDELLAQASIIRQHVDDTIDIILE